MTAGLVANLSGTKMYMLILDGFAPQSLTWTSEAAEASDTVVARAAKMDVRSMAPA